MVELLPIVGLISTESIIPCKPQRPYTLAWQCPLVGWVINADPRRKEALIVFNGQACQQVRKMGADAMNQLMAAVSASGTRLDLATDIDTMIDIKLIQDAGWTKRITTTSYIQSGTGDTLYIGSRKSEAFARVYRYKSPHPRAGKLRVEHELKKGRAKAVAAIACRYGVDTAQRSVANSFDYQHVVITDAFSGATRRIQTEEHSKTAAKTEMWLLTQCAPAFIRLVAEGVISDPELWVKKYMLGGHVKR